MMLCDLLGGKFTCEACEALCNWLDETAPADFAPAIGDIACSYSEIDRFGIADRLLYEYV